MANSCKRVKIDLEEFREKYLVERLSHKDLAKYYNCSEDTICRLIVKNKLSRPANLLYQILTYDFLYNEYVINQKTTVQIASETGVGTECIRKYLYKHNIPVRDSVTSRILMYGIGHAGLGGASWAQIIRGAKRRNLEFGITSEYAWNLFLEQNKKCKYSGEELILSKNAYEESIGIRTASLDRIDSSKGYIDDNVQWIHKDLNWMKQSFTEKYFIDLCKTIARYQSTNQIIQNLNQDNYIPKTYYNHTRATAKSTGKEFSLSIEYINDLFIKQGGICKISGIPLYSVKDASRTICLDRVNKSLGYTENNVQWLHIDVSLSKWNFTTKQYIDWCSKVANYENCL